MHMPKYATEPVYDVVPGEFTYSPPFTDWPSRANHATSYGLLLRFAQARLALVPEGIIAVPSSYPAWHKWVHQRAIGSLISSRNSTLISHIDSARS